MAHAHHRSDSDSHGARNNHDGAVHSAVGSVVQVGAKVGEELTETARELVDHGKRSAKRMTKAATNAAHDLEDRAVDIRDSVAETIAARPFTTVLVSVAAGAALFALGKAFLSRRD